MIHDMHWYVVAWRKYGSIPILTAQIICDSLFGHYVSGAVILLFLTIPCGIKIINQKWYLWYPRQLLWIYIAAVQFFKL